MLRNKVYIISIFFVFAFARLFSQEFIKVPDTTFIHNGSKYFLPIYINLNISSAKSLEVNLEFDYTLLNIISIKTDQNTLINETKPNYAVTNNNFKQGFLTINSSILNSSYNGILCFVELEPLFGLDSIASFNPVSIKVDGIEKDNINKINGKINIGFALEPIIKEGISKVFPNPFDNQFVIDFGIETPTELTFTIYSSLGRIVYIFPNKTDDSYQFFDSKGNLINPSYKQEFPKGYYKLKVLSVPWQFASGLYFLQMRTKSGIYNTNLLHLK